MGQRFSLDTPEQTTSTYSMRINYPHSAQGNHRLSTSHVNSVTNSSTANWQRTAQIESSSRRISNVNQNNSRSDLHSTPTTSTVPQQQLSPASVRRFIRDLEQNSLTMDDTSLLHLLSLYRSRGISAGGNSGGLGLPGSSNNARSRSVAGEWALVETQAAIGECARRQQHRQRINRPHQCRGTRSGRSVIISSSEIGSNVDAQTSRRRFSEDVSSTEVGATADGNINDTVPTEANIAREVNEQPIPYSNIGLLQQLAAYRLNWNPNIMLLDAGRDRSCTICKQVIPQDDYELHYALCMTSPRVTYNEDRLIGDQGECTICLEDLVEGDTIARLPCLCIYHKKCIDQWFQRKQTCPEHPLD